MLIVNVCQQFSIWLSSNLLCHDTYHSTNLIFVFLASILKKSLYVPFIYYIITSLNNTAYVELDFFFQRYNYDFEVQPVNRCPMNESDWETAAIRVGCNATHGYHCVPDRFHSTLIEFCYTSPRIMIAKGI